MKEFWYSAAWDGVMTLCTDQADAEYESAKGQRDFPGNGPYAVVCIEREQGTEARRMRAVNVADNPLIDFRAVDAMQAYGGSFVKALAQATLNADATNRRRLKAAFPDYFTKYEAMAREKTNAEN